MPMNYLDSQFSLHGSRSRFKWRRGARCRRLHFPQPATLKAIRGLSSTGSCGATWPPDISITCYYPFLVVLQKHLL